MKFIVVAMEQKSFVEKWAVGFLDCMLYVVCEKILGATADKL